MYSNVFDTVRTTESDALSFESLMYTSIINGLHPTLSLNQVIDSKHLIQMIQNDKDGHFLNFFKNGRIRVALYENYRNFSPPKDFKGIKGPISQFFYDRLANNAEDPNAFFFSSMPFQNPDSGLDDKQLKGLFSYMRDAMQASNPCQAFEKNFKKLRTSYSINLSETMYDCITQHFDAIQRIEGAIWEDQYYQYNSYPTNSDLSQRFEKYCKIIEGGKHYKNSEYIYAIGALKDKYLSFAAEESWNRNKNKRTFLYSIIRDLGCSDHAINQELYALVDRCYNEVVAASIEDEGESDIFAFKGGNELYTDYKTHSDHELDRATEKLGLFRTTENYDGKVFTWEVMDRLFQEIRAERILPSEWHDVVQEKCNSYCDANIIQLARNKLFKGILLISTYALTNTAISCFTAGYNPVAAGIINNVSAFSLSRAIDKSLDLNSNISKKEIAIKNAIQQIPDSLLTQVSTLIQDENSIRNGGTGNVN